MGRPHPRPRDLRRIPRAVPGSLRTSTPTTSKSCTIFSTSSISSAWRGAACSTWAAVPGSRSCASPGAARAPSAWICRQAPWRCTAENLRQQQLPAQARHGGRGNAAVPRTRRSISCMRMASSNTPRTMRRVVAECHRVLRPGGTAVSRSTTASRGCNACRSVMRVPLEHEDAPVLAPIFHRASFAVLVARLPTSVIIPERFPVKSRLHKGWKGARVQRAPSSARSTRCRVRGFGGSAGICSRSAGSNVDDLVFPALARSHAAAMSDTVTC